MTEKDTFLLREKPSGSHREEKMIEGKELDGGIKQI